MTVDDTLKNAIWEDYPYIHKLYMHLHSHPELSFHEEKTAERLAKELREADFEVTERVGGYGLVALIYNGEGPTVMIRTDMDALPVEEKTELPYASTRHHKEKNGHNVPIMHACGHDIHMSLFIGTARRMAAMKDRWSGTLMMIAQAAEEKGAGARLMLEDGLFERFVRPDYNLALHVHPELPSGTVAVVSGYSFANVDSVDIRVFGQGGHGAVPQSAKDPIVLTAYIVIALQTIVSREVSPQEAAVVTVGSIQGGMKHAIIPEQVDLQLTVRTYTEETRKKVLESIKRIAKNQAQSFGMPENKLPEVHIEQKYIPAVYNDPALSQQIREHFEKRLGYEQARSIGPSMVSEDFALFGQIEPRIPSLMFRLGATDPIAYKKAKEEDASLPSLHSPYFAPPPETTIKTGIEAMTEAALLLLKRE
ncbi:MAG: amidohydrolase [Campylobacterota bacterium]|nr:amidohydrolase [Campylobacterota bacterium]